MSEMRISRLVLNSVGVFDHLDLRFAKTPAEDKAEIHIFTGENGTGKTTLLQAMSYFDHWFNNGLRELRKNGRESDPLYHKDGRFPEKEKEPQVGIHFGNIAMEFYLMGRGRFPDTKFFDIYYGAEERKMRGRYFSDYCYFAYDSHFRLSDSKV